jgi:iron complex transport system substrate-binding protein
VPSITETLCFLGFQEQIVGCTRYCTHPLSLRKTSKAIGGTKDPNLEILQDLHPTHIFVNTEENTHADREAIRAYSLEKQIFLHESFPRTAKDALNLVLDLANIFGAERKARLWFEECTSLLRELELRKQNLREKRPFLYFIWKDPWMVAGDKTYISHLLGLGGFENAVATASDLLSRYPVWSSVDQGKEHLKLDNLLLFFSSEPFAFRQRHLEMFQNETGCAQSCWKVDGRLLSWYGSSTLEALKLVLQMQRNLLS